jgi:hypothetical protein
MLVGGGGRPIVLGITLSKRGNNQHIHPLISYSFIFAFPVSSFSLPLLVFLFHYREVTWLVMAKLRACSGGISAWTDPGISEENK